MSPLAINIAALPPAHEGHGRAEWQHTVHHYLLEPAHAIPALLVLAALMGAAFWFSKRARARRDAIEDR
jgi:hypothetical protein